MNRVFKNLAIYILIVLIAISVFRFNAPTEQAVEEWKYGQFVAEVERGRVDAVNIIVDNLVYRISGSTNDDVFFELEAPKEVGETVMDSLLDKGVEIVPEAVEPPPWWMALLSSFLPILLLVGLFFFLMQQSQGGGSRVMQFGKSKAKLHTEEKQKVTFKEVAGADEVKEELEEVIEFLKQPKKFNDLGAKIPKGVLLFGPPGTGKTLLARAVAGEAGVPFFSISGSDFVEMFVGVGASRVRDLFEQAKKSAPCIVFIDEIDAVGRQRGAGLGGGHDEREQTLNQLLVEMDGFATNEGIIIIAATNRPDILDPALLRPGRFDRQIAVPQPDVEGRREILKVHVKGKKLAGEVDLEVLARRTPGFTGADLANLVNEGALLAARRDKKAITMKELEDSIERVIAGPEKKSRVISEFEKKLVSYHEGGHAVVGHILLHTDPVHKVSIIPRGSAGGYTLLLPREDRNYITRSQLMDQMTMLLGGRVAEDLILEEISTGAQNDLERATSLVRRMITEFGMSDELGPLTFGRKQEQVFLGKDISRDRNYSEAVAFSIDKEARKIMDNNYNRAKKILEENVEKLHLVAKTLMEQETLGAYEFIELMDGPEAAAEARKNLVGNTYVEEAEPLESVESKPEQADDKKENGKDDKDDNGDGGMRITFKSE